MPEGLLRKLALSVAGDGGPVRCVLQFAGAGPAADVAEVSESEGPEHSLLLNPLLGRGLLIRHLGRIRCSHCGRVTNKSFGGGYCYPCFKSLARCDLCVMSPDRCHYHLGTCREPEWALGFCMQEHTVYLANTTGVKVGITRAGRELQRWMDQGATQARPILSARTRRDAGLAEVAIATHLADKTDWRRLVRGDAEPVELEPVRREIESRELNLPKAVTWVGAAQIHEFRYPVARYPARADRLVLRPGSSLRGTLLGIKGQYLLLSTGVINVRQYVGHEIAVSVTEPSTDPDGEQMDMFGR